MGDVIFQVAAGILIAAFVLGHTVGIILLWIEVKSSAKSTHQMIPISGKTEALEKFEDELERIMGGKASDINEPLDPRKLANFEEM